jgi:hypothetical protein
MTAAALLATAQRDDDQPGFPPESWSATSFFPVWATSCWPISGSFVLMRLRSTGT